ENCYLAYPSPTPSPASPFSSNGRDLHHGPSGDVLIFNALTLQIVNIVQAHKTSVTNICFNSEGTMLATASDKVKIYILTNGFIIILLISLVCMITKGSCYQSFISWKY